MVKATNPPLSRGILNDHNVKIVSGGQTGVDRAALDFAILNGIDHGGWCPSGRKAEDGPIPLRYDLRETRSADYDERTERNILDSDATLIFVRDPNLAGGTATTHELALRHERPMLVLCEGDGADACVERLNRFLNVFPVNTLNVAGPRESEAAGLGQFVEAVLGPALLKFKA